MVEHINEAIFLGNFTDFDLDAANSLVGQTIGGPSDQISRSRVGQIIHNDADNDGMVEESAGETISFSNGNTVTNEQLDNVARINITLNYSDGTPSFTGLFTVNQDAAGNVFLISTGETSFPNILGNNALAAAPIESISINSIFNFDPFANETVPNTAVDILCFTKDTFIESGTGAIPVENLTVGDKILTKDNGLQKIRWIGSTIVPAKGRFSPISFKVGSLGNTRAISVSPQHRMLLSGWHAELLFGEYEVLVAAKHLVNGKDVYKSEGGLVEYYHILFDEHQIIYANGAASESFHPAKSGMAAMDKARKEEIFALFPQLRSDLNTYGPIARPCLKGHEAAVLINFNKA